MSNFSPSHRKGFRYKPDSDFQRNLGQSLPGVVCTLAVMLLMGHWPGTDRIDNVLRNIFKDSRSKRDYSPDLKCVRCGQKFEAKWKSQDGIKVGPQLLEKYTRERAFIVFVQPSKISVVEAAELGKLQQKAKYKTNHWSEPFLDFQNVRVPVLFELQRWPACNYNPRRR